MPRVVLLALLCAGCTDSALYNRKRPPIEANRVALRGRVCTEDPVSASFPVRMVLVVDQAAGPLFADYDPGGLRIGALSNLVQSALSRPEYALAVVGYGGLATRLAPVEGAFTRNPGELLNAITRLSLPLPCAGTDRCRDYDDGLRAAGTLIEDDLAALPAGLRVLTQYVVVLINAGPSQPLGWGCEIASWACQRQLDVDAVNALKATVRDAGAAGLQLHVVHLAADPEVEVNDALAQSHAQMAFAGAGRYTRFEAAASFDLAPLRLFDRRSVLRIKRLVISNVNALPGPDGALPDSDGDGLADRDELERFGTLPSRRDTDGDGVGDLAELLAGFDPLTADVFGPCEALAPGDDLDLDGLSDCEEVLLGTDRSLVDSDGDGLPDRLELALGTDYLNADGELDADGDGVVNGDEVRDHTDPRSADLQAQLGDAYRYTLHDEGRVVEPRPSTLRFITGVKIVAISAGSTAGLGALRFLPGSPPQLAWTDAGDSPQRGPMVPVEGAGVQRLELPSSSFAPIQGDEGRIIRVEVDPAALPPTETVEAVQIAFKERHCLSYTVRNVRLVETVATEGSVEPGLNELLLYLAQAPEGHMGAPGPFRLARVPIRYRPPASREPGGAVLPVSDEEFVAPRLALDPGP